MQFPNVKQSQTINPNGKNTYLKINPGTAIKGIFRGVPYIFYSKWDGQKSIPSQKGQEGAKFRFKINFVMSENGLWSAKIWEQGYSVYDQLKSLNQEYPLEKTIVTIKRQGEGLKTSYLILPAKEGAISPDVASLLEKVKLHDFSKPKEDETDSSPTMPSFDEFDERSFP